MLIKEFLNGVCEQIKYKPIRSEIAEELENHLKESKEHYLEEGMEEIEAEEKAIAQMGEAEKIGKKLNKIHKPKFNWQLLILTMILWQFGFLVTILKQHDAYKVNIIMLIIGILPCIFLYFFDYRKLQKCSSYFYGIATLFLLYADGRNYIRVGNFAISPSTISTILYLISFVGILQKLDKNSKIAIKWQEKVMEIKTIYLIMALSIFSILLLATVANAVKDAILLILLYLVTVTVKLKDINKQNGKTMAIVWGSIALCTVLLFSILFITSGNIGEYRVNRFVASFLPEIDPQGAGWQGIEQRKIINGANLLGQADNIEQSSKLLFDEESSVFPLIAILANYGILFGILMVVMVFAFNIKLILDARKIKNPYGKMLAIAISCFFLFRSVACLLMNVNLGIKASFYIPFIYSEKIELVIDMICLSLLFSVYRRKDIEIALQKEA